MLAVVGPMLITILSDTQACCSWGFVWWLKGWQVAVRCALCVCLSPAEPQDPDGMMASVADFGLSRALALGQVGCAAVCFERVDCLTRPELRQNQESPQRCWQLGRCCAGFVSVVLIDVWGVLGHARLLPFVCVAVSCRAT